MTNKEIIEIIAQHDAPNRYCCRCHDDTKATLFRYGAFFCSDKCAEAAGDYTLEGGQAVVPNYFGDLNAIQEAVMRLQDNMRDQYNDNLWEYVTTSFDYDKLYNMDRVINATAEERARTLAKTILSWNKLKEKMNKEVNRPS